VNATPTGDDDSAVLSTCMRRSVRASGEAARLQRTTRPGEGLFIETAG
jgi:hypothetical protein